MKLGKLKRLGMVMGMVLGGFVSACDEDESNNANCYSPTQNTDIAYEDGALGCECETEQEAVCANGAALIWESGFWSAVEDGPCMPEPPFEE